MNHIAKYLSANWGRLSLFGLFLALGALGWMPGMDAEASAYGGLALMALNTTSAPFQIQPRLTQIAMAVPVEGLIADQVCPRIGVGGKLFTYTKLNTEEGFTIPDTRIGRTSAANQVEFGAVDVTDQTEDHGLEDPVPNSDIELAQSQNTNLDPLGTATERTTTLMNLAREQRVATLLTTSGNYASSLRTTLSGTGQWSDYANSNPVSAMLAAMDLMLVRPNTVVMGQDVWTKLRQHPKVVESVKATGAGGTDAVGTVAQQALADLLEVDEILVGRALNNSAKKGQTPVYPRIWGKHCAMLHLNRNIVSAQDAIPTFCFTAEWMRREVYTYEDPKRGVKGSTVVKVVDQVKELIAFQEAGYLFTNAVA